MKTHSEANLKYMEHWRKKSKIPYPEMVSSVEKEAKEVRGTASASGSGQSSVVSYFLNITAFCKDNERAVVEQDILNSFRKNGFQLIFTTTT